MTASLAGTSFVSSSLLIVVVAILFPLRLLLILVSVIVLVQLGISSRLAIARIALISSVLGFLFGGGAVLSCYSYDSRFLGFYVMILTFFHLSEYVTTAIYNPNTVSLDSFLLNHSKEYSIAAIASWIEYSVELYLFPSLKSCWFIAVVGILLSVSGEALRKFAMFTAGSNFTHNVQFYKRHHHTLVTTGIYKFFRHPSYVGWFYWSMGTQLVLCNPICCLAYVIASWNFFKERIETEEELLIHFFGQEYLDYQKRVSSGLPFIKGYNACWFHLAET